MTVDELVRNYPRLYHMATGGSWSAIREHGLLPTSSIVQTSGLPVERREELLTQARTVAATFTHPVLGSVTVRDQTPLREHVLASVLTDMASSQWIGLLNSRVFFWLHPDRLRSLLGARRSRHQLHDVIMIDTRRFVEAYQDRIELSSINSGSTLYPQRTSAWLGYVSADRAVPIHRTSPQPRVVNRGRRTHCGGRGT
jgi:hypothetical protein